VPSAFAKGDTVRNREGVEAEVVDANTGSGLLIVRPAGDRYVTSWFNDVTLVKRASQHALPVVALTEDDRQLIANLVNDAGYPTLAHKLAPAGAPTPAVGDWFKASWGLVYRVASVGAHGRLYFDGGNSESITTVLNDWTKVEVTDA
jgi:hypothetical protein